MPGDPAPGLPDGVVFVTPIAEPLINEDGKLAITGLVSGPGVVTNQNDRVVWRGQPGSLVLVARSGDPAPGTGGATMWVQSAVRIGDAGEVVVEASLNGGGGYRGYWHISPSNVVTPIAIPGFGPVPDLPRGPVFVGQPYVFGINGSGTVLFSGRFTEAASEDEALFGGRPDAMSLLVQEGSHAPGTGANVTFTGYGGSGNYFGYPACQGTNGIFAFVSNVNMAPGRGIWSNGSPTGDLTLVVQNGEHAAGLPSGVTYDNVTLYSFLSPQSHFFVFANLAGVPFGTNNACWLWNGEGLDLLIRQGDQAPGLAPGITLDLQTGVPFRGISDNDQAVLYLRLAGAGITASNNDVQLWISPSAVSILAREGDQVPGLPTGVHWTSSQAPIIARDGRVAMTATIAGPGINGTNAYGIWIAEQSGDPQLVLQSGDLIEVAPGVFQTFNSIFHYPAYWSDQLGGKSHFNNAGQLPLLLRFGTNNSVFVLDVDGNEACLADIVPAGSSNGVVNIDDLLAVINAWGPCPPPPSECSADIAPAGGDGVVDIDDLLSVINAWGPCP